jgi:hypothetical protein
MGLPQAPGQTIPASNQGGSYIYPSPTRGASASIVYTMASAGSVKIRIHNETGRLVDTIAEDKPSGWQSSTVSVGKFAQGLYFYMLSMKYDNGSSETQPAHKFVVTH